MLEEKIGKVACVYCIDEYGYTTRHYLFLNISELKDDWAKEFLNRVRDDFDSYTIVRKVLYV